MSRPRVLAVIPARYRSTRFPGKPLADIDGLPMILHVYRRAARIKGIDDLIVATDDERIREVVTSDGGTAVLTARSHPSGTSRVAEVAAQRRYGIVVNIQGDEPLLPIRCVEKLIVVMRSNPMIVMGTLASPESDPGDFTRPDVVKVVCDHDMNAVYFSRLPIPHAATVFFRHIGVYGYRRPFILGYGSLKRGPLERYESLEQLRAVENGFKIRVVSCRTDSFAVDLPADIKRVEKRLRSR